MSKGSENSDRKTFDANFDAIDWGEPVVEPPHPKWKDEDYRYGEEWLDSQSKASWGKCG